MAGKKTSSKQPKRRRRKKREEEEEEKKEDQMAMTNLHINLRRNVGRPHEENPETALKNINIDLDKWKDTFVLWQNGPISYRQQPSLNYYKYLKCCK